MQKDTLLLSPSTPLASNTSTGGGRQASASGASSKSETGHRPSPQTRRKPSMSKVIMRAVADRGARSHVSLAALKKAVTTTGYNMTHNNWRFKRVLKKLVDKGMLKQVTGRGASGSFRLGKNQASKAKLKAKRRQQRLSRQRQSGQRRPGQRRPPRLASKQGRKRLFQGVRRVAKCRN